MGLHKESLPISNGSSDQKKAKPFQISKLLELQDVIDRIGLRNSIEHLGLQEGK